MGGWTDPNGRGFIIVAAVSLLVVGGIITLIRCLPG